MRRRTLLLVSSVALAAGGAVLVARGGDTATGDTPAPEGWTLAWSDEFDAAENTPPDRAKWTYDTGNLGVNAELEYYTDEVSNVRQNGKGQLEIVARKEKREGWDYTSGRILTQGLYTTTYGRIEARMKIPYGQGIWPAFWMLGANIEKVSWPDSGEIDIMENIGKEPNIVHGTIHGPGYSGAEGIGGGHTLPDGKLADDYHVYGIEWTPTGFRWLLDGEVYAEKRRGDQPSGAPWVYDHPFFLLLNVATGGEWPGNPDETTVFPQTMSVDYVRVYKRAGPDTTPPLAPQASITGVTWKTVTLAWTVAADEGGLRGYDVYRGKTKVATIKGTSYVFKGLKPRKRYSFSVQATDIAGQRSPRSNVITVRTCKPRLTLC